MRGAWASVLTLCVCLFFAFYTLSAFAADDTNRLLTPPQGSDGLYMEHATFGDVIGLQPGFETMMGKPLSIAPRAPLVKAPQNSIAPAKIQKSALTTPKIAPSLQPQPQQFIRDVAPIYTQEFLATTLHAQERSATLLSKADLRDIRARRITQDKTRKRAAADLKKARKIRLSELPRDRNEIKLIAQELDRPKIAVSLAQASEDHLSAPKPAVKRLEIADISLTPRNTKPDVKRLFAEAADRYKTRQRLENFEIALQGTDRSAPSLELSAEREAVQNQLAQAQGPASNLRALTQINPLFESGIASNAVMDMPDALDIEGVDDLPLAQLETLNIQISALDRTAPASPPDAPQAYTFAAPTAGLDDLLQIRTAIILLDDENTLKPQSVSLSVQEIPLLPQDWLGLRAAAPKRQRTFFTAEDYANIDAEIFAEIAALDITLAAAPRDRTLYKPELIAANDVSLSDALTKEQSLAVIDMVGLPGDARILDVANEERATLVASVKNTSTQYTPQPIGVGGLETLRDAVEHAVATNPDIKIAEAQQEDAYYAVNEARAGFLPKLDLNAGAGPEISRQSGADEIVRMRREVNATLRQTVFDFGLTRYDYLRAKEGLESAKLETLQSVEELVYEVSVSYLGVLQQQKVVALAHQNLEAHEYILDLVTAQKEAGQGTAADVNRVSSSLSNARSFMLEEESKLQQSRDQYRRLLNAPPGLLVDPLLDLSLLPQSAEEAAQRIEAESPRLLQVKADAKSIENQLRSQRGNYLPKVELEVQGNLNTDLAGETGQTRDARAMMFLRYNLYNGGADAAVAARLRARVKEVGYEFEKKRREVEQNIRNDFTAIDASRAKVNTIREQVGAAKEVVRLYEQQFRAGDRTAFDLLDAQQALIGAKLEQILNSYQETRAGFRVMQQLGNLYYVLTADSN